MSGIAGMAAFSRTVVPNAVTAMAAALAHRGTARFAGGSDGRVLFGAPGSGLYRGASPEILVCADAALYRRQALIQQLGLPETVSDAGLIAACYLQQGTECVRMLAGDWAFALWDTHKQIVFCARDPLGVRPLYYSYDPGRLFAFASEVQAVLPAVTDQALDEVRIGEYLARSLDGRERTFFRAVRRLPAGSLLVASTSRVRTEVYWSAASVNGSSLRSDDDAFEGFRHHFTKAVDERAGTAGTGAFLSGGLDSSSIVCAASRGGRPLETFTAVFPGLQGRELRGLDEATYRNSVVQHTGATAHDVRCDTLDPLAHAADDFPGEPVLAPNLYLHRAIYAAARTQGFAALLDGLDGDTTVSHGYESLAEMLVTFRWPALYREIRALSRGTRGRFRPSQLFYTYCLRPLVPAFLDSGYARWKGRTIESLLKQRAISEELVRRTGLGESARSGGSSSLSARKQHAACLDCGQIQYMLEVLDGAAARAGITPRYPFFDKNLIEFCLAVPPRLKLYQGWDRYVMRRAMEGILPADVQWRFHKANLTPGFLRGMQRAEPALRRMIFDEPSVVDTYVDVDSARAACSRFMAAPMQHEDDAYTVFAVAGLWLWLSQKDARATGQQTHSVGTDADCVRAELAGASRQQRGALDSGREPLWFSAIPTEGV